MTYAIPDNLLQAIVGLLNSMPAGQSRGVLNAIEAECTKQDEKAKADQLAAHVAEANAADKA